MGATRRQVVVQFGKAIRIRASLDSVLKNSHQDLRG